MQQAIGCIVALIAPAVLTGGGLIFPQPWSPLLLPKSLLAAIVAGTLAVCLFRFLFT